jgi:F-type H+-transporting ATPase subunit delta
VARGIIMASGEQATNIAKALFDTALKSRTLVKQLSELRRISDLMRDSALAALLKKPGVAFTEKSRVLAERAGGLSTETQNLVALLLDKGRLEELDDISIEYQRLLDSYHGIEGAEVAEVTTAIPLDDSFRLTLGKRLTEMLGRPVVIKASVDPGLVGGIRIRVGDKLIDGSLRHKLEMLSKELV